VICLITFASHQTKIPTVLFYIFLTFNYYHHHFYHLYAGYLQLYTWNKPCTLRYSVAAILYLQFVLQVMLFCLWNMFCTFTLSHSIVCVQCPIWLFCCCYCYYLYYYYNCYMFIAKENWPANIPWTSCICWTVLSHILYYVVICESKMSHDYNCVCNHTEQGRILGGSNLGWYLLSELCVLDISSRESNWIYYTCKVWFKINYGEVTNTHNFTLWNMVPVIGTPYFCYLCPVAFKLTVLALLQFKLF
jgi:hypothetical protein